MAKPKARPESAGAAGKRSNCSWAAATGKASVDILARFYLRLDPGIDPLRQNHIGLIVDVQIIPKILFRRIKSMHQVHENRIVIFAAHSIDLPAGFRVEKIEGACPLLGGGAVEMVVAHQ